MDKPSRLDKLKTLDKAPLLALFNELETLNEHAENLGGIFGDVDLKDITFLKGEQGNEGKTPMRGEDYLTEDELQEMRDQVTPIKSIDYYTEEEKAEMLEAATPKLGEHYFTNDQIDAFLKEVTPVKGTHYQDGKDGNSLSAKQVIEELQGMEGALETSVIKGLPTVKDFIKEMRKLPKKDRLSLGDFNQTGFNNPYWGGKDGDQQWHGGGSSGGSGVSATIQTIAASGAITAWNSIVEATAGAADITLTLPAAVSGKFIWLKKVDPGVGHVVIVLTQENITLVQQNDAVIIASDGTNSYVVASNVSRAPFVSASATVTLTDVPQSVTADATAAAFTITLPTPGATNQKNTITVTKTDVSTNAVTISGAETPVVLNDQGNSVILRSDGTVWYTLSAPATITPTGTIGNWAPTTVYTVGDTVTVNNVIYERAIAGTSGATFDLTELGQWTVLANYTDIGVWAAATVYPAGKLVSVGGRILRRLANGTSGAVFDNTEAATWGLVNQRVISAWVANTYYYQGEQVTYGDALLQLIVSGVSTAQFDITEDALWTVVMRRTGLWTTGIYYRAGDTVINNTRNGDVLVRVVPSVSAATFEVDATSWNTLSLSASFRTWTASQFYYVGDLVTQGGRLLRSTTARTASAAFNLTEAGFWTPVRYLEAAGSSWTASTVYYAGDIVKQGTFGRVIQSTTTHTSNATFDAAEAALWQINTPIQLNPWTASTVYFASELAVRGTSLIGSTATRLATATFDATEAAFWLERIPPNPTTWVASTYYFAGDTAYHPVTKTLLTKTAGGMSTATFDATEAALWTVLENSANIVAWTTTAYYYAGDIVSNTGSNYRCTTSHLAGVLFDAPEKLNFSLFTGRPVTTVTANYTLVETDDTLNVTGAGPLTITVPAARANVEFHVNRLHPAVVTTITIATSGGETIVNPSTGTAATSTTVPGIASTYATIDYSLIAGVWCAA